MFREGGRDRTLGRVLNGTGLRLKSLKDLDLIIVIILLT